MHCNACRSEETEYNVSTLSAWWLDNLYVLILQQLTEWEQLGCYHKHKVCIQIVISIKYGGYHTDLLFVLTGDCSGQRGKEVYL